MCVMKSRHKGKMIRLKFPTERISENLSHVRGFEVVAVKSGRVAAELVD